jgi:type I restriction enzyme S subunit
MMQPLSSVCEIIMGQAPAGDTYNGDLVGLPLIAGASDFGEITPKPTRFTTAAAKISQVNDIIVCVRATIGDLNWSDGEYCLGRGVAALRVNERKADRNYIWRAVEHGADRLSALGRGATFKQISKPDIADFEIPLPPLEEQKRIAAILDQADELRRKRQRALDRLNQLGQAIFIEMFGELAACQIGFEPLGSLTSKIGSGSTPKGGDSAYKAVGIPLIRSMNVRDGHFLDKGLAFIDDDQASKLDNVIVRSGDVLLNITGASVARVCTAPSEMDGARVNQHVSIIRPKPHLLSVFLEAYILLPLTKKKLLNIAEAGATRQAITKAQIEQLAIPVPPIAMQKEFARRVSILRSQNNNSSSYHNYLEGLFASLQQRAFKGGL